MHQFAFAAPKTETLAAVHTRVVFRRRRRHIVAQDRKLASVACCERIRTRAAAVHHAIDETRDGAVLVPTRSSRQSACPDFGNGTPKVRTGE